MFRDKRPEPEEPPKFVWKGSDSPPAGDAEAPGSGKAATGDEAPRKAAGVPRTSTATGRALVAAAVIVPLAGGVAAFAVFGDRHASALTVAETAPVSSNTELIGTPSPSLSPSPSRTPTPSESASKSPAAVPPTAPAKVVTVIKTVVAATHSAAPTASGPQPIGEWLLDGNALDSTGAHNGTASNVNWSGGAAVFNGANNSYVATSSPVLSTGAGESFTVSAWVDLTTFPVVPHYNSTVVSQDGSSNSSFYLQYLGPQDCWAFTMPGAATRDVATSKPQLNTWTHLVGVYDAANDTQYLYVNGAMQGTATESAPTASTGPLAIGRAQYGGADTDGLYGSIKDVKVFDVALNAAEVSALD